MRGNGGKRGRGPLTAFVGALFGIVVVLGGGAFARADLVTYQMVPVGNAGNAADSTGYGAVAYDYQIGKYDVTIGQYTAFLNAVARSDPYGLYNGDMTAAWTAGISRSGSSGSYSYGVMNYYGSSANRPITFVSWFDAARFANWMANGQPTGPAGSSTTENGAYNLNGVTYGTAPTRNATNPNTAAAPTYWIPTENEWYKAAYYQPAANHGPADGYWAYATRSDTAPGNTVGGVANQANYKANGVYATGGASLSSQNYLTDVGAFSGSASFFGTFDQSGLVHQWNDLDGTPGFYRGLRGGWWGTSSATDLSSSSRTPYASGSEGYFIGIRLAGFSSTPVPEIDPAGIGSVLALVTGALGLLERRRLKNA